MNITAIIIAAAAVGGTGILVGILLGVAGDRLKVEVDEREEKIMGVLPGNNCGGCGSADYKNMPGYEYSFGCDCDKESGGVNEAAIAEIVKRVISEMK